MKTILTLLWLTMAQARAQAPVPCPPAPLTEAQVLQLVKDHVPEGRIVQFVGTCRIGFAVTQEVLTRLRTGGATDGVLTAVRGRRQLTLDQARQEIAVLEKRVEEIQVQGRPGRDQRVEQVDADYRRQRDKLGELRPKDRYETAAEFATRQEQWNRALEELDQKQTAARAEIERAYQTEWQRSSRTYVAEIAALKARTYPLEDAKLEFLDYDPDYEILKGKVGGEEYGFAVPRESARRMALEAHPASARVERPFIEGTSHTRVLVDIANGKSFPGLPVQYLFVGEFVAIPPGEFSMGSNSGASNEKPEHLVRITKGFEMGKYEVTQAQWKAAMKATSSYFKGNDRPVDNVSWNDAQAFLRWLNARDDGYRYRLPTEAEWEYAARAGSTSDAVADLDAVAWHGGNSGGETHPVGQKRPNAWGLYDMLGNVWEWCADWYGEHYYASTPLDAPRGPALGTHHVVRGASWNHDPRFVRTAYRFGFDPVLWDHVTGLRLVREAR